MKVLVATDGSDAAVEGAQQALSLLKEGVEVVLAMVVPEKEDPMATAGGFEGPTITEEEAEEEFAEATEAGEEALERTASVLAASEATVGDTVRTRLITSDIDAGSAIVEVAEETGADLIVIGASGKGFLRRIISGSVSDHVVRNAPCPVLVVRHQG